MSIFNSDVQNVINDLQNLGMTYEEIASRINNRVSPRTLQRYKAGKSQPQNKHVLSALKRLVTRVKAEQGKL